MTSPGCLPISASQTYFSGDQGSCEIQETLTNAASSAVMKYITGAAEVVTSSFRQKCIQGKIVRTVVDKCEHYILKVVVKSIDML